MSEFETPANPLSQGFRSRWVLRRSAARVVVLNDLDQIFLIQAQDPADPTKAPWWEIPGGGIDRGETSAGAVARELYEEAGINEVEIGPVIWTQHVQFDFGGYHFDQDEVIHVARTTQREVRPAVHLEALEALAFKEARWWDAGDVANSNELFLPPRLPELLGPIVSGELPDPPLDISPGRSDGD